MELKYGLISADDHVYEHPEVWTARMSKQKWGDLVPHVETDADGSQHWLVAGEPVSLPRASGAKEMPEIALRIQSDGTSCRQLLYKATERLKAMNLDGVDYSVLYPTMVA